MWALLPDSRGAGLPAAATATLPLAPLVLATPAAEAALTDAMDRLNF
jgi:hypothetical protein